MVQWKRKGVDYPCGNAVAATQDWMGSQMDVSDAFLNGELEEDI